MNRKNSFAHSHTQPKWIHNDVKYRLDVPSAFFGVLTGKHLQATTIENFQGCHSITQAHTHAHNEQSFQMSSRTGELAAKCLFFSFRNFELALNAVFQSLTLSRLIIIHLSVGAVSAEVMKWPPKRNRIVVRLVKVSRFFGSAIEMNV